jgi:hypothetical protein
MAFLLGRVGSTGMEIARVLGGGLAPGIFFVVYLQLILRLLKFIYRKLGDGYHWNNPLLQVLLSCLEEILVLGKVHFFCR